MKRMPTIKRFMTPFPLSVDVQASADDARAFMAEHAVHHLPATEDGRLIGMVSEPAIRAALEQAPQDADAADIKVADIMARDICVVDMSERLDRILDQMARERLDAVAVTRKGKLAGVFTITDACASFAELLREQVRRSGGGEAA